MVSPLDKLIEDLRAEASACRTRANLLDARIQGLEEAAKFLATEANGAEPRKRRNIRAMVGAELGMDPSLTSEQIAQRIGCRVSQVRIARRHPSTELGE